MRILRIHEHLSHHRQVTAASLAKTLGVTDRTIKRDIEIMRSGGRAVVTWEPSTRTYIYEKPCEHLPLLSLDGEEANASENGSVIEIAFRALTSAAPLKAGRTGLRSCRTRKPSALSRARLR